MRREARYANAFDVGFDAFEFVIECAQIEPGGETTPPHTRIVTTPPLAKQLCRLLVRSVEEYEMRYGRLPTATASDPGFPPQEGEGGDT